MKRSCLPEGDSLWIFVLVANLVLAAFEAVVATVVLLRFTGWISPQLPPEMKRMRPSLHDRNNNHSEANLASQVCCAAARERVLSLADVAPAFALVQEEPDERTPLLVANKPKTVLSLVGLVGVQEVGSGWSAMLEAHATPSPVKPQCAPASSRAWWTMMFTYLSGVPSR